MPASSRGPKVARLSVVTEHVQVSTATETRDQAVALAGPAVQQRLAAGAQIIGPVTSVFWHLGEYGTGQEWQLLLKTTAHRYPELESYLLEHHPWDNPEVCAVPITAGADRCLQWISDSVDKA
ncbi:divalent-cation tolerance protein CutA [Streptomyces sp. NBC_01422]|uniref:divalent-cation tolerance protein CutA n=1 Tax=Streptomyces sp. NBC_01422 TaxID=2903859 RepID=UPI002E2BF74E|nr:divalent-cation tolerance protein CutA [Streptomyces sp. NBC_01422]